MRNDSEMWKTRALYALALFTLLGAAVIHLAQIRTHLDEWVEAGAFFVVVTIVQALLAVLVVRVPSRTSLIATAGISAAIVVIWALSRTAGVPIGPEAGEAEPVGRADLIASAFEILTVLAALFLLRVPSTWGFGSFSRNDAALSGILLVGVGSLTLFALQPTGCHHGPDATMAEKSESDASGDVAGHDDNDSSETQNDSEEGRPRSWPCGGRL